MLDYDITEGDQCCTCREKPPATGPTPPSTPAATPASRAPPPTTLAPPPTLTEPRAYIVTLTYHLLLNECCYAPFNDIMMNTVMKTQLLSREMKNSLLNNSLKILQQQLM